MNNEELLRRYLDGDLSPSEEQEALHIFADDPEMRSMLRFEQMLSRQLGQNALSFDKVKVPEGFSDRVMHRIEQTQEAPNKEHIFDKIREWYRQLWVPKQIQWRPAYAFIVALLVMVSLSYPLYLGQSGKMQQTSQNTTQTKMGDSVQEVSARVDQVMLRFVYIDGDANSVAVAGDFSNWKPVQLDKHMVNGKEVWTGLVSMSRGEHDYMFIENGTKWVTDPLAPVTRDDGFGNKNAVIYL
ncbi:MAG TPA: glycogen-binding domain-containing protein [Balneolaceae bacterium]|nr:glycogen-binding domain-containing protein [Balneolaceae bacterium]